MNFETAKWRRESLEGEVLDDLALERRRKRRLIIIAAIAAAAIAVAAFLIFGGGSEEKAAGAAAAKGAQQAPTVSVIVPGRQQVARTISATGTIAARRDMPVGIAGEGGMVARVLVEAGQWVGAGQTLAVIERSVQSQEAQQLAAAIDVARADARLAQQELERAQALVSRGFVSKADVERRVATRDAANARVRVAQAQLGASRARIGRLDVRAPAAGLILDRNVEAGQVVSAGSGALFRIAQGGQMELLARLPQTDLATLSVGVPVTVTPVGSQQSYQGSVWQISPIIDAQTRQGEARIAIPYNRELRPGGFASAEVRAGATTAPLLPESAVLTDDAGSYVLIVTANNTVQRRPVRVGTVTDRGVVVAEGLNGNERVVESAGAFLNPGEKVRPQRAASR
ncbi:MAG TPA: efflux RND transporter periplasmic adaptor subunit [Allosphingosinicella sp.]|uniref:efflux RND transporter periplasmic adaptor subunit n=1 Tax=Allosphingosinicella sp. TaxID=2823234 RepID=UPI002ED79743